VSLLTNPLFTVWTSSKNGHIESADHLTCFTNAPDYNIHVLNFQLWTLLKLAHELQVVLVPKYHVELHAFLTSALDEDEWSA